MDSDLISRSSLERDAFEVWTREWGNVVVVSMDLINSAPTVDAAQVVRCKDCRSWGHNRATDRTSRCDVWSEPKDTSPEPYTWFTNASDYCCHGQKKDAPARAELEGGNG